MRPITERFWAKVDRSGGPEACWLWTGATTRRYDGGRGYGVIGIGRHLQGNVLAHRLSWVIHFGPIPVGLYALHRCDTPPCVNPRHLWLGTYADNGRDMVMKGRHFSKTKPERVVRGERHGNARLTVVAVQEIRRALTRGEQITSIARRLSISRTTVGDVRSGRTWRHVA